MSPRPSPAQAFGDEMRHVAEEVEHAVLERGGERRGSEIRFLCPVHEHGGGEHTPSADYNAEKHVWKCRACGAGGGVLDLARRLGVRPSWSDSSRGAARPGGEKRRATGPRAKTTKTTRYRICDERGELVAVHVRHDRADGTKSMPWETPDGKSGLGGRALESLPLYGCEDLGSIPEGRVVLTEGEKARDALAECGFLALGTVTGAECTPSLEAFACLKGRHVLAWADNDDKGRAHMDRCAARAIEAGATEVRLVVWPDAPDSGDAADLCAQLSADRRAMPAAASELRGRIEAVLSTAKAWTPPEQEEPEDEWEDVPEDGPPSPDGDGQRTSQADRLVKLVLGSGAELWHTPDGECYATVLERDHDEHLRIRGREFRHWIAVKAAAETRKVPSRSAIEDALSALGGYALYAGKERAVHIRLAEHGDTVLLDLGDAGRSVVEISAHRWNIVADRGRKLPVRFRRPPGALALPMPEAGGAIDLLRPLLNVDEGDFDLVVAWLLGALHPSGPYPALAVAGEHGTGKSTTCAMLVGLVDPKDVPLRRPPKDERDLFVAASCSHVVAYNNISSLSADLSDALSALATEGGFACRKLYEDDEEARFRGRRPLILNGIEDVAVRGDLGDRCIRLVLPRVNERKTEREILDQFRTIRPRLIGALLDGVSCALRRRTEVRLKRLPRLADFALWIEASAPALGREAGALASRYMDSIERAASSRIDDDVVASAIVRFMEIQEDWEGTAAVLLEALGKVAGFLDAIGAATKKPRPRGWPETPRGLSSALTRLAPDLRAVGLDVDRPPRAPGRSRARLWTLRRTETADGSRGRPSDRPTDRPHENPDDRRAKDGSDGSDGPFPPLAADGVEPVVEVDL